SATIGFIGPGVVKVFSSAWAPFKADHRYALDAAGAFVDEDERRDAANAVLFGDRNQLVPSERPLNASAVDELAWPRVDLGPLLAGTIEQIMPTVLQRRDGRCLFYRGAVNGVHGDSGSGKTMLMSVAAAQEIASGNHVMYVDGESRDG